MATSCVSVLDGGYAHTLLLLPCVCFPALSCYSPLKIIYAQLLRLLLPLLLLLLLLLVLLLLLMYA